MNRHLCEGTGKDTWAAQDNRCVRCRPVAHVEDVPLTEADVREMNAPLLADLIGEVGGEEALRASEDLGLQGCFEKPVDPDQLIEAVERSAGS